ncbi:MAG: sugar phosphate isomerase/epimerase, partial [Clostridia bacterium]|nr:sugar phosphate isomerase/epimerase [Clostridia bacterium]
MKIALQLYSLRDDAKVDYVAAVKAAGQVAGYTGCEFAGYGGLNPDEMKALLAEAGLEPIGTHLGIDALRNNLAGEVAYAAAVGIKTAVCPYVSADSAEGWAALGQEMEGFAKAFAEVGIPFGYH